MGEIICSLNIHMDRDLVAGELVETSSFGGIRGLPRRRISLMSVSKLWGVSILSAGEDSGVTSLVHEGPA